MRHQSCLVCPTDCTGTLLGPVRPALAQRLGLPTTCQVIAGAGHDTAAAVGAVPDLGPDRAYLSSGTWSLLGAVIEQPHRTPATGADGLSNEAHIDHRQRLNANVMGLWILQQARRGWLTTGAARCSYAELAADAAAMTAPAGPPLAVNDDRFFAPHSEENPMPQRIITWYAEHGERVTASPAELSRRIVDGLAHAYGRAMTTLRQHTGFPLRHLTIVGGGNQHHFLNQQVAAATGCSVRCGAIEASVLGNAMLATKALQKNGLCAPMSCSS